MRVTNYLNTTKEEVAAKHFNICFGFSLGNKYFTREHIRSYILWALENTKDKVAVLIPDKIQAINYEVKNGYSPKRALSVALRKGAELETVVRDIVRELNIPISKIEIVHWQDVEDAFYQKTLVVIKTAFAENEKFRHAVVQMVKETPHIQTLDLQTFDYEKLAQYIINELPVLIDGIEVAGVWYTLFPYPGFAKLDYLALDLQEGTSFPEISKQLEIRHKLRLIEAYAD
ncbi:MAG: tRNA-dependent cyclodipeptide synthase [Candidatus Pacebacteria bacterium]|nr:tRNA-dependent cyclodipeptide synthase [Candidatus Paceibacterota bacterium]